MEGHQFFVMENRLVLLQYYCTCNAGAQMVNPCAHVSSCIYLIMWTLNCLLDKKLKTSKRDAKIKQTIINLTPAVKYVHEITKCDGELYCVCRQPWRSHMLRCKCCEEWNHPDCLDIEVTAEVKEKAEDFKCDWCDPYIAFMSKLKRKEGTMPTGSKNAPPLDHCDVEVDQSEQDDQSLDQNDDS